jgi:alanine-synthesizing transaminase
LLREAKVAVSPGIGFGEYGDQYVRFALIENEHRTRQAIRGIRRALSQAKPVRIRQAG